MKAVESEWDKFRREMIPDEATERQVETAKATFYSGAAAIFHLMASARSEEEFNVLFDAIPTELEEYFRNECVRSGCACCLKDGVPRGHTH